MINLQQRSYQKELMDADDIPFADMAQTLKELNSINTLLGGHTITVKGLKQLMHHKAGRLTICEIGCGGGDNLFAIKKYCDQHAIKADFIGIDMNKECIAFAKLRYPELNCQWIVNDYAATNFQFNKPDIIFSSLFCHHFTDPQLVSMVQWMNLNSKGFLINDLQRHWLAYYLIKYLTRFFSRSYLVKNDACLSVARSFRKKDWQQIFKNAGISSYTIEWKWAFRYLVTHKPIAG
jgi:2-polyprenyl-3-methyl-5-hydroxy-6-metoxy-1,4-benzoquinol methylase